MFTRKKQHRVKQGRHGLEYSALENRELLAGITFDVATGVVLIGGTHGNDVAEVTQNGGLITVTQSEVGTRQFVASDVTNFQFVGLFGDDFFRNTTSIAAIAFGGPGNDTLIGGSGNDRLVGNHGADRIVGNDGDDLLVAGVGDDEVLGGGGDDRLLGVAGENLLRGGAGDDFIFGGLNADRIFGEGGNDLIGAWHGNDQISGGDGSDQIFGGDGDDTLFGDSGDDFIFGQNGNDSLVGNAGSDLLNGNNGDDVISSQFGDDRVVGGPGLDRSNYSGNSREYQVTVGVDRFVVNDLRGETFGGRDVVFDIEELAFSNGSFAPADLVATTNTNTNTRQTIFVQPIIAANSNGSNVAEFFGNGAQQSDILRRVDAIFAQAGVDVEFLTAERWNNTGVNVGFGSGTRPSSDLNRIVSNGDAAGLGSRDRNVIDLYLVERVPGFGNVSEFTANGLAFVGSSGIALHNGDNLVSSASGRDTIARVVAHEIGHNLGLSHVAGSSNLLSSSGRSSALTQAQIDVILRSSLSRTDAPQANSLTAATSSTINDDPLGGCGCGNAAGCPICGGGAMQIG